MLNFIFDADGTLIDSYDSIIERLNAALKHFNISYDYEFIHNFIIRKTCSDFIAFAIADNRINKEEFDSFYASLTNNLDIIKLIPDVKETLSELKNKGYQLFIYSHRGESLNVILKNLGIEFYFVEVVGASKGLARKPSGEGIDYIIEKYQLNKEDTFYVGDREIDMLCARNAKVKSIYFNTSGLDIPVPSDFEIKEFKELLKIQK